MRGSPPVAIMGNEPGQVELQSRAKVGASSDRCLGRGMPDKPLGEDADFMMNAFLVRTLLARLRWSYEHPCE